jgi:hypothetical protein
MTALRINEASGSLGSLQISDGFGSFLTGSLIAGPNITITNDGSGSFAITASAETGTAIGEAEDGTYNDGLFTDFAIDTPIGTAIDRFNEVLKALAPAPAPSLTNINSLQTGTNLFLSFGSSNDQSSATPSYANVASSAGLAAAVDVNGAYNVTTSSNNIRLGAFNGDIHVSGVLNSNVDANSQGNNVQNYPLFSFGDSEIGILRLNVNGSTIKEVDLTESFIGSGSSGIGTGSHLDNNGSGFNFFSQPTTGTFSNGNAFNSFQHRTGQFVISSDSQRLGWNYARILHVKTGSTITTNYVEWVNDDNEDQLVSAGNSLTFEGSGSVHLSGVEYFKSGNSQYKVNVSNTYKYVYDDNNVTFSTSNNAASSDSPVFTIAGQSKPTIGGSEDHTKVLHITGSGNVSANYFISGSLTAGVNVTHPFKSNLSNSGQSSVTGILMYNLSNTSTDTSETFLRENFRIVSGSYNNQSALTDAGNVWNSTVHMTASNGSHANGLQFYNKRLYSSANTLRSGDFRSTSDGGKLDNAPSENPNYSGESGQRTFYRWFKNTTGSTKYDFSITINGSGTTIVPAATALNSSRVRVFVKFPSNSTRETGWLDLATEFVLDSYSDNDGAHTANGGLSFDSSLNATNIVTLGTVGVANNEYIGIRIEADTSWSGFISQISVTFGAGTGTITAIPDLDDIDCNDDGTDSNLSFGSSKSIADYTNVGDSAGLGSAVDINGIYETDSNSNNLRRSVFAFDTIIEGDLNEDVAATSPDFVANSFSDANSGSLVLEINGSNIHTVSLAGTFNNIGAGSPGSGTGTSFTSNSGFFDLSVWEPAEFDNEVPYFLEVQRTGKYRVHTNHQRNGWNYARVKHIGPWGTRNTNYVEWVNDVSGSTNDIASAGNNLTIFGDDSFSFISGVKYFNSPSASIETRVSNLYRNVYSDSSSAITFANLTNATGTKIIQSGSGLTSTKITSAANDSLQNLNTTANSQNTVLHATGTINFSQAKSLPGSSLTTSHNCAAAMTFAHPLKSNHTTSTQTTTNLLVWTPSNTSDTNLNEHFTSENFRLVSNTYGAQSDISGGSNNWNSQRSINDQSSYSEHATGLLVYDTYLISPKKAGSSGDFRNHDEGGGIESPAGNVNYSSLTNSTRDFFRSFLNNTTNDLARISITLYGDATLVGKTGANAASLGANKNIFVELKIPGKTDFLDLGKPSAGAGNISGGDGCLFGDLNGTIDANGETNVCTFNGLTVNGTTAGAEYFVIKISASENWTGYLDRIQVAWSG